MFNSVFDINVTKTGRDTKNIKQEVVALKKSDILSVKRFRPSYPECSALYLLPRGDAPTAQLVDVLSALVHEAADQPVVAEHYTGHLGDVLVTLVLGDVGAVVH